ncbi:MAG: efflux RND transporter permease subunit [Phaeovulum sp.]|uniref:efflux RND transporter permease subunit n=1 Tax=Phaeovulum sp. TaxID=2934796 RepID=UPI0027324C20|nr:efflux RND transporter permease subunit [Phaeovulum sp.]MDP3862421.1 efflux RND transporter permease subunit [Phaeovulum sp.]
MAAGREHVASAARGVLSYFTRHKTLANIVLVIMIGAGIYALPRMRSQTFPDTVVQNVNVSVAWSGAGADEVDRAIVQVLEPSLLVVEGVKSSTSRSSEGSARIALEFEPGWDMSRAEADVKTALTQAGSLPDDADEPKVARGVWRETVTDVVITGPLPVEQLGRLADELVTRLYAVGVTRTSVQGYAAPRTIVELSTAQMIRHNVTMSEISNLIGTESATAPAGELASGGARVRTGVEKRDASEIAALVLRSNADGSKLTIGDVATIYVEGADRARAFYVGPNPAMTVNVSRSDTGDAVAIQRQVEEVAATMALSLPEGVKIDLIRTRSEEITARINLLVSNGSQGLALVMLMLFLFLNARTALWVAAGIPVAMLAAVAAMHFAGMTLNQISIFALIITLGIVVDDAIVVGEHADFRVRHLNEPPVEAAENAARRMAAPVLASSITTIIAFAGLMIIGGRMGSMIADIPFTVIAVLAASLIECFLILPNHMAHALTHAAKESWYDLPSRLVNRGFDWMRFTLVRPLSALVIRLRYPVLAAMLLLLAYQMTFLISGRVQWRFFNGPEQASVSVNFSMLPGASRNDTREMLDMLQAAAQATGAQFAAQYGPNPVKYVLGEIGGNSGRALAGADTKDPDQLGGVSVELIDRDLRTYSAPEFIAAMQALTLRHPMVEELSFRGFRGGPGGDSISVQFSGAEVENLKAAAEALKTALSAYPEASALEDSLAYDKEELILELTPQGQALGFTIEGLGRELRLRMNGIEAASFPDGPRSASIRVQVPKSELADDFVESMQLRTPKGEWAMLSDIVHVSSRSGFTTVRREDGLRLVSVTGELSEDNPDRATEITEEMVSVILPRIAEDYGVTWRRSGLAQQQQEFFGDALLGLIMCLVGIYIALAWIFSSWTRPVVVMAVIPFGLIGAIWGHYLWGMPMSMFSVVGMIGMSGIIINDSIVLVSTVDEYAARRGLVPAIIDAVSDRLRPVFLTTATTVLGLAPVLYAQSNAALFLKPTVITLCYGLGFGMVLVLVLVPALLAVQQDFARQLQALRRGLRAPRLRVVLGLVVLSLAAAFAATLGRALLADAGVVQALGQFAAAALAVVVLATLLAPLALRGLRRRTVRSGSR